MTLKAFYGLAYNVPGHKMQKKTYCDEHHGDVKWSWPFQIPEEVCWAHLKVEVKSRLRRETFKNSFVQSRSVECQIFHVLLIMSFNYV